MNPNKNYSVTVILAVALLMISTVAHVQEQTLNNPEDYLKSITEQQTVQDVELFDSTIHYDFGNTSNEFKTAGLFDNADNACYTECGFENTVFLDRAVMINQREEIDTEEHLNDTGETTYIIYP